MDFSPSDDQVLLRDSIRALLAAECTPAVLRAHMSDLAAATPLWSQLRDFAALGVGPTVDLCIVMEELGYVAAPSPFFASACLAAPVLAAVGDPCLDEILAGTTTGTLALAGSDGTWRANSDPRKTFVLDAGSADMVVVIGGGVGGADGGDCTVATQIADDARRITTLDSTRPLYDVECATGTPIGTIDPDALDAIIERATVALAAELVGTARRLLDMSLAYAKERVQFGVAIGSFQVIQHKLVDMSLDVERAWSAVYFAAMTLAADASDESDGPDSRLECKRAVHVAKATAGIAAKHCAKDGIQIHGGIGFTWEHDLHLFIRRAYASEALLGTTSWHHEQLGDLLF